MKAFSNVLICVFELYLQVAVLTGASQVYTCTFGDTARLFSPRSDREHLKEFRQYRVWKGNISFAVIEKGSQTGRCLNDVLKPFCLTKVEFQVWNETHLLLTIKNTNYDDSGNYGVEHVFRGMEDNDKETISLKIKEPTDIPSHRNSTRDGNKTRGISSGVSLTLSVLLVVRLLSSSLFLLWASN